jgi:hypothetical protein
LINLERERAGFRWEKSVGGCGHERWEGQKHGLMQRSSGVRKPARKREGEIGGWRSATGEGHCEDHL